MGSEKFEPVKEYVVTLNDCLLRSPEAGLGEEAAAILRQAVIVIQPGDSPGLDQLVLSSLRSRRSNADQAMGRISVGCLP